LQPPELLPERWKRLNGVPVVGKLIDLAVEPAQFGDGVPQIGVPVEKMLVSVDDHPELCAPVADVIVALHAVPHELEQPVQRGTDQRAANVTDVHWLGDVGTGVINQDDFGITGDIDAESIVVDQPVGRLFNPFGAEGQVDEAGAGDLRRKAEVGDIQPGDNAIGHGAGRGTGLFRQRHGAVGLKVAEP
jgi:hypothetical protein